VTLVIPKANSSQLDPHVLAMLRAAPAAQPRATASGKTLALIDVAPLPSLRHYAQRSAQVGRWRIDPECAAHPEPPPFRGVSLVRASHLSPVRISLPANRGIWPLAFSPDASSFACAVVFRRNVALGITDVNHFKASVHREVHLNTRTVDAQSPRPVFAWFRDSLRVICCVETTYADSREWTRSTDDLPQIWDSRASRCCGHTDALPSSEAEYLRRYFESELAVFEPRTARLGRLGIVGWITDAMPSPDSRYLAVSSLAAEPCPDSVGVVHFVPRVTVWDIAGPPSTSPILRLDRCRFACWAPTTPSRLVWIAQDVVGSRGARDILHWCDAPFATSSDNSLNFGGVCTRFRWTTTGRAVARIRIGPEAFSERVLTPELHECAVPPIVLPGERMLEGDGATGSEIIESDGAVYVVATREVHGHASTALFEHRLATGERRQILANEEAYEPCVAVLATKPLSFITICETAEVAPHYRAIEPFSGRTVQITSPEDVLSVLSSRPREMLTYRRRDGVSLSSVLHFPPDTPTARLRPMPAIFWIYPRPVADHSTRLFGGISLNRFRPLHGALPLFLLLHGYAILVNYSLPVLSRASAPSCDFLDQMTMNAEASVATLRKLGVTGGIAIAGHSYGAFVAVHLLARTRLFSAGIVRSGAYNRALTPFGYQNETRPIWQARQGYIEASPLSVADQIDAPLLLIHGAWDDNPATTPVHSIQLYEALRRLEKPARLVLLPLERHGYGPLECAEWAAAEIIRWCEQYVAPVERVGEAANA